MKLNFKKEILIGGLNRENLIKELEYNKININKYGKELLLSELFSISSKKQTVITIEITVGELGFSEGALIKDIIQAAENRNYSLCPVELGPFMRLQYKDQPQSDLEKPVSQHKAPSGSITIASPVLSDDDDFPKGFYLVNYQGNLWLRGYISSDDHVYNPEDSFIFISS